MMLGNDLNRLPGAKTAWILRGPPGSGKTTVGRRLERVMVPNVYVSLDQIRKEKGYDLDWGKMVANMKADVDEMKRKFREACEESIGDVILDNVHSRLWEYEWAVKTAQEFGYLAHVIEVQADIPTCWERQRHGVPWDKLMEIFERWEPGVKMPDLLEMFKMIVDMRKPPK